ncbi:MAG: DUF3568 domain-containing protein [Thermodesulfovibrionales bacterium]
MTKTGIMFILLCSLIMMQGCVAVIEAGAGAGTVAYVRGELQTSYAASLDRTWDASIGALKDIGITIYNTKKDATEGDIEATKADGTKVKINLKPKGQDITTVKIRVGIFGDEEVSRTISNQISKRLEKTQSE